MRRSMFALTAAALGLALTACGGDDSSLLEQVGADPTAPADGSADDSSSDDGSGDAGADTGSGGDGSDSGLGDLDLDDLEGLDLDEMLDGIDLDDLDGLDLDELLDGLDDFISGFGGDGRGTVTVDGVRYEVISESCVAFGDDFFMDGPAQGSDGSVAWIDANRSVTTRADMADFVDEMTLDMLFGDSDVLDELYIDVRVGATSRFDDDGSQPNWSAMSDSGFAFGDATVEFELSGNGIRGAGQAMDVNGIAADFGQTVPIEFELACG